MKFIYEYRTSDNVLRKDIVVAGSRDAAFSLLKSRGIRPARLVDAPGFFNKLFGRGKRWMIIALLFILASLLLFFVYVTNRRLNDVRNVIADAGFAFDNKTRRQIVGDTAVIELGVRNRWSEVFDNEGERFLSAYAMPGIFVKRQYIDYKAVKSSLRHRIERDDSDSIEVRQIKAIVSGMKDEIREYCAAGGRIEDYCDRLMQRQEEEYGYYCRAAKEIEQENSRGASEKELIDLWKRRNGELRNMGIKMIPLP